MIRLNLIPPYKKAEIHESKRMRFALRWELQLTGILVIFISLLLSINYILKINMASSSTGNNEQAEKVIQNEARIKEINAKITEVEKIQNRHLHWKNLFDKINENFFSEIEVQGIIIKDYTVLISGVAKNRDDLIFLKVKLEKESCFSEINLPLSDLVSKENASFQISFNVKSDCLKLAAVK